MTLTLLAPKGALDNTRPQCTLTDAAEWDRRGQSWWMVEAVRTPSGITPREDGEAKSTEWGGKHRHYVIGAPIELGSGDNRRVEQAS